MTEISNLNSMSWFESQSRHWQHGFGKSNGTSRHYVSDVHKNSNLVGRFIIESTPSYRWNSESLLSVK